MPANGQGVDYVLAPGHNLAWITVGNISVNIRRQDEGVAVDLYLLGAENQASFASTYAFFMESEEKLCDELGIEHVGHVAEWVGQHYRVSFSSETCGKRIEWIRRYAEAHG